MPPEASPSQPVRTEQDLWREAHMYGAHAFISALETAEAVGLISWQSNVATLTSFMRSVFDAQVYDVEGEERLYKADIKRPDGKVRRVLARSDGQPGLGFDVRYSDVLPDGREENVEDYEWQTYFNLAQGVAH